MHQHPCWRSERVVLEVGVRPQLSSTPLSVKCEALADHVTAQMLERTNFKEWGKQFQIMEHCEVVEA